MSLTETTIDAPMGPLTLVSSERGLRAILWPSAGERTRVRLEEVTPGSSPILDATATQLAEYFEGGRHSFDLPLDPQGTEFQLLAWKALADIPYGQTTTYSRQAQRIGRPNAVRAVAAANGKNPISIVLPCHRIIGADGSLTGFAGGLAWKRWLLDHEGGNRQQSLL